jgi:hypothetical protein
MKYVISWKPRPGGSAADNEAAGRRVMDVYSKWSPSPDATFHQFVTRLDGNGGFAVVEGEDSRSILRDAMYFGPYFEFEVFPVLDMLDGITVAQEAMDTRDSIPD